MERHKVIAVYPSKSKNAIANVFCDFIEASDMIDVIDKFEKKYPKYIVFSIESESDPYFIWFNPVVESMWKKRWDKNGI